MVFAAPATNCPSGSPPTTGPWDSIAVGTSHVCALTTAGQVYCWGEGDSGRLGVGGSVDQSLPTQVGTNTQFTSITAGSLHTCALDASGNAYCWGDNSAMQVGTPPGLGSSTPQPVASGHQFVSLSAGGTHTCGIDLSGDAYCWGSNADGQLGNGVTIGRPAVPTLVDGGHTFASIDAGGSHTCGITSTSEAYCWGDNAYGQLGTSQSGSGSVPVAVAGGHRFRSIDAGHSYTTCGITTGGATLCWGLPENGQLGLPPGAAGGPIINDPGLTSVSVGSGHTCGLAEGGFSFCWGSGQSGALGLGGSLTNNIAPIPCHSAWCRNDAQPTHTWYGFSALDAGSGFTCGVRFNGFAYCWGLLSPSLGDGSTTSSHVPIQIWQF